MRQLFFLLCCLPMLLWAQIPQRPEPARYVNDYVNWLSTKDLDALEQKLKDYHDRTMHQIVLVITPNLQGKTVEVLANEWFTAWGIGQKGKDDGVLILVTVKERKSRIEVGRGLEVALPDVYVGRLLREELTPHLKNATYAQGFNLLIDRLMTQIEQASSQGDAHSPQAANQALPATDQTVQAESDFESMLMGFGFWLLWPLALLYYFVHRRSFGQVWGLFTLAHLGVFFLTWLFNGLKSDFFMGVLAITMVYGAVNVVFVFFLVLIKSFLEGFRSGKSQNLAGNYTAQTPTQDHTSKKKKKKKKKTKTYKGSSSRGQNIIPPSTYSDYSDKSSYSDYSDKSSYSDYSDYSDKSSYSDYSDSYSDSFGGGSSGGGGASGDW